MTTTITVPIRIRVDPDAVEYHQNEVDAALRAAATRALANAARRVPVAKGQAWFESVPVTWSGSTLAEITNDRKSELGAQIRTTMRQLAKAQGIENRERPKLDVAWTSEQLRSPDLATRGRAFWGIMKQVEAGDWDAFWLALTAIRPDGAPPTAAVFASMGVLRKRDPATFKRLLEYALTTSPASIVNRTDREVFVDERIRLAGSALGGALRVALRYSDTALVAERQKQLPGFDRFNGLLDALRAVETDMARYLDATWTRIITDTDLPRADHHSPRGASEPRRHRLRADSGPARPAADRIAAAGHRGERPLADRGHVGAARDR